MADSNPQAGGSSQSTSADSNPQAGANQPTNQDTTQHPQAGEETESPDVTREWKRENQALRKRIADFETAAEAAKQASMSEVEKQAQAYKQMQEENASLLLEVQQSRLMTDIAKHGASLGILDPETAALLLQAGGKLETDDKGKYTNVQALLKDLAKEKPFLVSTAANGQATPAQSRGAGGGATNPALGSSKEALSWEYIQRIGRENPQEYNERRAEIQSWLQRQNFR